MCSFTDAWLLSPATEADAYRVEWAATPSAWERGEQTSAIFPRHEMDLWSQAALRPGKATRPPSVALGHVSCFAYTIPEKAVRGPLYVKVTGLYADGTETAVWRKPRRLDGGGEEPAPIAPPAELTAVPAPPPPVAPATPSAVAAPAPAVAASARPWPILALVGGLAGLTIVVAARRLRRAPRLAPPPR